MIKVDETDPVGELEPSFPYRDVQIKRNTDVKEFYDLQSEIGRGKFGTVYRCRERGTGLSLAAKFVSVARKEDRRNVEREVDIMRSLQHPRLLQLYDAFEYEKNVCLILELIEGGELFERVIDDDFVLTEKSCTIFMRQICEGIQFVHQQHILHLDLKPENILCLTKTGNRIKIIDFGLARRYEVGKKLQVLFGTPEFVAPEVVNFDQIGFNTDMWSVGVICYVLLSGLSPFMGDTDIETMANVTIAKYDFEDEVFNDISEDAKDFIAKLLVKEKENRMCAEACLHHRWLRRKPAKSPPARPRAKVPEPTPPAQPAQPAPIVVDIVVPADKPEVNNNDNNKSAVPEVNNNSAVVADKNAENKIAVTVEEAAEAGKLAGAKDNLRNIVERWTEHPDGPYIFDTEAHTISPCPSLASVLTEPDAIATGAVHTAAEDAADAAKQEPVVSTPTSPTSPTSPTATLPLPYDRLLGSERRASDSNCLVRLKSHHLDIHDRINLADEIRKLSEKLFRMASWAPQSACSSAGDAAKPAVSPLAAAGDNVESTTVTETKKGCTTTKTTFRSSSTTGSSTTTVTSSGTSTRRGGERGGRLTENFTVRAVQTQIPTKRFWPIEPGRMPSRAELLEDMTPAEEAAALAGSLGRRDSRRLSIPRDGHGLGHGLGEGRALGRADTRECRDAAAFRRLTRRSLSSASASSTTHSAPQSPRWSPDPELPPPPTSDLTKDLVLRLLHRLDSVPSATMATASLASHRSLLDGLHGLAHWQDDPFFKTATTAGSLLDKKRTLITSHSGGP
ncbi:caM kinase-like vesicle-associated protein [Thrips palmi]|uniref:CaM kinase-like vesicle-associated protein n=1 Tax=Thrips palmi TaxID=161013 RepID=A0A6P8ZN36_THRPL|nr:caM kinase-like vesicle-associated protein [Thrips palmi]